MNRNGLYEPLIPLGEDAATQQRDDDELSTSSARGAPQPWWLGPYDWSLLLHSVTGACADTFATICSALSCCWQWVPGFTASQQLPPLRLTDVQAERLAALQARIQVPYDGDDPQHQEALRQLWQAAFPGEPCVALKHARWRDMGWQNDDPATDFRGGGLVSLHNLLYLATEYPHAFVSLKDKARGQRSDWEYPFAAAGVNLTFTIASLLDLRDASRPPSNKQGHHFIALLDDSDHAFEEVFCAAFELLDATWLDMRASYMQFPAVLQATRQRLELAFSAPVSSIEEMRRSLQP